MATPTKYRAVNSGGLLRLVYEGPGPVLVGRVRDTKDVADMLAPHCSRMLAETFGVLLLDAASQVIGGAPVEITRGLINSALVHPREVFRGAILLGASAVICWHNHPSGNPEPSAEDRAITAQLVAAGRLLEIPVQDHVIIGHGGRYSSFAEMGLL